VGNRRPTKEQGEISNTLEIDFESIMVWLKEKIIHEVRNDEFAFKKHYKQPKKKLS
jgi:hypothetical protein